MWRHVGDAAPVPGDGDALCSGAPSERPAEDLTGGPPSPAETAPSQLILEIGQLQARLSAVAEEAKAREAAAGERAWKAGFEAGQDAVRTESERAAGERAAAGYQAALAKVAEGLRDVMALRVRMRRQMEEDLVKLSIAIARRVLRRELTVDPEALLGIVRAALDRVDARDLIELRFAPAEAAFVERAVASLGLPERVKITADAALARGSVIVETGRGALDASITTQLDEIDRGLADLTGKPGAR